MRIQLDKVFPLAETRRAHEHLENEHSRGKTILQVRDRSVQAGLKSG